MSSANVKTFAWYYFWRFLTRVFAAYPHRKYGQIFAFDLSTSCARLTNQLLCEDKNDLIPSTGVFKDVPCFLFPSKYHIEPTTNAQICTILLANPLFFKPSKFCV